MSIFVAYNLFTLDTAAIHNIKERHAQSPYYLPTSLTVGLNSRLKFIHAFHIGITNGVCPSRFYLDSTLTVYTFLTVPPST